MQTLSHGFKKPQTGDKGSVWFPALEDNITQLNSHDHDGTDSERLTALSITSVKQTIASGSWISLGGGNYRQLVTVPAGFSLAENTVSFKDPNGHQLGLTMEQASTTTYYVYINDNSIAVTAYYGV